MNSKEILEARKKLDAEFEEKINLTTGELTGTRDNYNQEIEKLQKECTHEWNNEESAIIILPNGTPYCPICRKRMNNKEKV